MLLKLPIMLLNYAPIMLRAVPLCPKRASIILQLNAQLEYIITLVNVLLECFILVVTALLEYIDLFLSQLLTYCSNFCFSNSKKAN